jgi:hypothetical protein
MPVNLANNTNYVAYLTVAQRVNGVDQWAAVWATRSFTIQIPPAAVPARPTITATPDNANARIDLSVTQSGGRLPGPMSSSNGPVTPARRGRRSVPVTSTSLLGPP